MLLIITCVKFRMQKYSYFRHLQNIIALFHTFFGTIIDNYIISRTETVKRTAVCQIGTCISARLTIS